MTTAAPAGPLVLVVEDEPKIASLLVDYLASAAFATHWIANGLEVVDWVRAHEPDMVLLDIMLPGKDGVSVCKALRTFSTVPIIMVTARVDEIDRLLGLELGADDYVCKPFSPREVIARIKAVLRRLEPPPTPGTPAPATASHRGIVLNEDEFCAFVDGARLELTPVEFRLLACLVNQPRRVFSRGQLMGQVYPDGRIVSDRTVDSHVKNLRKKLGALMAEDPIRSVYGVGYKID